MQVLVSTGKRRAIMRKLGYGFLKGRSRRTKEPRQHR